MVGQDISRREGLCLALSRLGSFATSSFRAILGGGTSTATRASSRPTCTRSFLCFPAD